MPAPRTIIVGDVHGMLVELEALLSAVELTKDDVLVFLGDLIDKGPDSAGVVKYVNDLRKQGYNVVLVLGNHEDKFARFRLAYERGGEKAISKMKDSTALLALLSALWDADLALLDSAVPYAVVPGGIAVHGGILPSLETLPTMDEYAAMSKGEREKFHRILRLRHVTGKATAKVTVEYDLVGFQREDEERWFAGTTIPDEIVTRSQIIKEQVRPKGSFITLGDEGPDDPFWANVYDGRFGHVYFGHSPYPDNVVPEQFPYATGVDLGAVFGGRLCAAIVEEGVEGHSFVSLEASGKFATSFWEE